MYLDEVTLDPKSVVSVLATAALLQLDGLLEKCAEVMNSTINAETAIPYYEAAIQYGITDLKKNSFDWMLINLLSFYSKHSRWLKLISADLLSELIASPNLVVMQTEFALYALLKVWTYIRLHNDDDTDDLNQSATDILTNTTNFFAGKKSKTPFLSTTEGRPFIKPFKTLRFQHLINHPIDMKIILEDNIIPRFWLNDPFMMQWNSLIRIDNSLDSG